MKSQTFVSTSKSSGFVPMLNLSWLLPKLRVSLAVGLIRKLAVLTLPFPFPFPFPFSKPNAANELKVAPPEILHALQ